MIKLVAGAGALQTLRDKRRANPQKRFCKAAS